MRALVVSGPGRHAIQRVARPKPRPDEVLVETEYVALCGTDFRLLRGELHDAGYPVIPGHEWVGVVREAPARPDLVGARVVGHNFRPCRACRWCEAGRENLCAHLDEVGFTLPGACAEFFCLPSANVRPLPVGVEGASGCLVEPLCVALHAVERAPLVAGRTVTVLGAGAVGLLVAQIAMADGAAVTVVDPDPHRRGVASCLGVDHTCPSLQAHPADQPDVVFDATGVAAVFPRGLDLVAPAGAYVLVGYSSLDSATIVPSTVMLKELDVIGVLSGYGTLDRALAAVAAGQVKLDALLGSPDPFERYADVLSDRAAAGPPRRAFAVMGEQ